MKERNMERHSIGDKTLEKKVRELNEGSWWSRGLMPERGRKWNRNIRRKRKEER